MSMKSHDSGSSRFVPRKERKLISPPGNRSLLMVLLILTWGNVETSRETKVTTQITTYSTSGFLHTNSTDDPALASNVSVFDTEGHSGVNSIMISWSRALISGRCTCQNSTSL